LARVILGLIPARGNSKRLPGKNLKILHGRPLIGYAIMEAMKSPYLDQVVVTTDSQDIIDVAAEYGADTIKRPWSLATDKSLVYTAIKHALDALDSPFKAVCLIQPTSPLILAEDIKHTVEEYERSGKPCMTVALGSNVGNGAVYIGSVEWLKSGGSWDDQGVRWVAMDAQRSVDVNTAEDFEQANQYMQRMRAA
jgi:CMP-N-acetylneuraminic acid synthetase